MLPHLWGSYIYSKLYSNYGRAIIMNLSKAMKKKACWWRVEKGEWRRKLGIVELERESRQSKIEREEREERMAMKERRPPQTVMDYSSHMALLETG